MEDDAGTDAQVALAVIRTIRQLRLQVVDLHGSQRNRASQWEIDKASNREGKCSRVIGAMRAACEVRVEAVHGSEERLA